MYLTFTDLRSIVMHITTLSHKILTHFARVSPQFVASGPLADVTRCATMHFDLDQRVDGS